MNVLDKLDKSDPRLPPAEAPCRTCLNAMWVVTKDGARCHCSVMSRVTWGASDDSSVTACTGFTL